MRWFLLLCAPNLVCRQRFKGDGIKILRIHHHDVLKPWVPVQVHEALVAPYPLDRAKLPMIADAGHIHLDPLANIYLWYIYVFLQPCR